MVVRRSGEGARPIFDRDEIKQASKDRADDAAEKRVVAIVRGRSRSRSPIHRIPSRRPGDAAHENFKVQRERFEMYRDQEDNHHSKPYLNERWQHQQQALPPPMHDIRDKFDSNRSGSEKLLVNVRPPSPRRDYKRLDLDIHYRDGPSVNRNRNSYNPHDVNGSSRYLSKGSDDHRHGDYESQRRRTLPVNPHDLRLLSRGRSVGSVDARHKILERRERDKDPVHGHGSDRKLFEPLLDRKDKTRVASDFHLDRGRSGEKWESSRDGRGLPDRLPYKEWQDKPDMVPKGPSYFEHDTRGDRGFDPIRRGRGRGFFRGRGIFRGPFSRARGIFRGRPRGAFIPNMNRGRGKRSPHQWEHDLFLKMSPDTKMDSDNRI